MVMVRFTHDSGERKTILRTVSFKKGDANYLNGYEGSEKMLIEEKESGIAKTSNKRKVGMLKLQKTASFKKVVLDELYRTVSSAKSVIQFSPRTTRELNAAAIKLQKVYKSYRTRRNLADCAVVIEELWWKALDFAALRRCSISFFDSDKSETAVSRWARARTRAAKVGKGLSKNENAQKLALRHWLEAVDPRHRYGHNLHLYYDVWFDSGSSQPFFYWLDVGDGKEVNLENCPRTNLQRQCIIYLRPKEREAYEVIVESGKLVYRRNGVPLNTDDGTKWIFVLSTTRNLYVGQKQKGRFQHSSFLAGGAITAAGRLVARNGVLEAIWPYSGHYHPTEENFMDFIGFLEEHHVNLTDVKKCAIDDDDPHSKAPGVKAESDSTRGSFINTQTSDLESADGNVADNGAANFAMGTNVGVSEFQFAKRFSRKSVGNAADNDAAGFTIGADVGASEFQFAKRFSCKWTSGTGTRIGCVRDYPPQLQFQALEQVNLSPRTAPEHFNGNAPIPSPRPSPKIHLSPRLAQLGLPSPKGTRF